ncbi:MAG: hypothetical protein B9S38_16810 [Verrucomicrobiia bacterium Tous-C4TDCM]|nr:MAG: hypothetical protein B9S38_16810 [Verrucomicrobiae bacterium Tous-C4TDCM]
MSTLTHSRTALPTLFWTLLLALSGALRAAPPDLTATGVIPTIDRSETYNLGPTGLRGWIHLSGGAGNTHGADGTMTGESRQILVTVASTPGSAVLAVDDVILGAMAAGSGTVPNFSSDARKALGAAIGEAEKTEAGTLRVKRWRAGTVTDENIPMTIMGDYTATAPYSCPKSTLVLANARNKLVGQLLANTSFLSSDWSGAISALALLAGVQSGDPDFAAVQTRLQTYARSLASAGPVDGGLPIWDWAYEGLFLAEYYLATGDANVLPGINSYTLKLVQSQSINGTFGHGPSVLRPDGSGRRMNTGYGPVNAIGIVANTAIVLGKKALLAGGQAINPEIDGAIQRGSDFFAFYVNKGPIPYGEHEPFISGHSSNGKDPMCAVLFGVQAGRAAETEYYARMTTASYRGREYGHTGQGFSYLWSAMGANMGGALAAAEHLKPVRWHLDLSRRTDGSFAYDGAEQYGGGTTSGGTYLGASGYYGMNATACYILTYALPLQRLYITGKRDLPANPPPLTLDAATVAHAVAAANFKMDSPGFTTAQLIISVGDYDPVVRHYAAIELGKRTLSGTDLTTLRNMVTGTNANGRMGACQALGLLKDPTALPTIVARLDKTTETDLWVRAKAASAIRSYTPATISTTQRDTMLTRYTANATDPDVIAWSDPIQMSNNFLSLALFGDAIYGGNSIRDSTVSAAKSLLYPAVQAGLKQPDSYSRSGASRFCFDKLPVAGVQALIPDFFKVIEIECLADRMWSADSRANGIKTLSKYKVREGIPYALEMLEIPEGFGWGSGTTIIAGLDALAAYGDAARWTLPTLRTYLGKWSPTSSENTKLVSTIASIENAITAAVQVPGLAEANSEVVSTTGPRAVTLTGSSPRSSVTFTNVTAPTHGTLTGTAPILTYTPDAGYTGPDFFTFEVLDSLGASYPSAPGTVSIIVGTAGTGLKGEYYDNIDFTNLKLTRTDAQVNFDWGTASPNALLAADTFSVRWSGLLRVPETGTYTFSTLNSDGVRLYVNGVLMIDDYLDQTTNWKDGTSVNLTEGQMVDLQMNYYENTGSAVAKLKWTGPSFAGANGAIIGSEWLYDGTGVANRTAYAHSQSVTLVQNTAQPITLTGSGGTLTYTVITPPASGTLTGTAPNLTYTPSANFSGADSFTFLVNNGTSNSSPATVSIGIQAGQPVDFFWTTAASGNWSGATAWSNAASAPVVPAAGGQAFYRMSIAKAGTYTATHDLNSGFLLNQLNMAGAVTLAGTNSLAFAANGTVLPQFNQNSASTVLVGAPLNLSATTVFGGSGGGSVEITGIITGAGGLTQNAAGMLKLYSTTANTYSGGTIVNSGNLHLGAIINGISPLFANPMGSGPVTLNGGTIEMERVTANNTLTIHGGRLYSNNGWGATWSGPIILNGNATLDSTWNLTCSGVISGAGGFTKTGGKPLIFSGTNNSTGANRVSTGTLTCSNSGALGTGPLDITTGAIVALNYTGTRGIAALAYNAGAPLAPGTYGSTSSPATHKNDTYFSGTGTVTVLPPSSTSLALTGGSSPSDPGAPLTFTSTVSGVAPTGNVAFYSGTTPLGTSALNGSFQATFTTSSLAIGSHGITARYAGNSSNAASSSEPLAIQVNSLTAAAPTNPLGTPGNNRVSLTWTASPGAASYYVKRSLANGGPYTVIGNPGSASFSDLTAMNGSTYYYVVSAINAAGESTDSSQVSVVPVALATSTTLTSSLGATGAYGSQVTFTATVSGSGGPATGMVTFRSGATVLGAATLGSGAAAFPTSSLALASHTITATYEGDSLFGGSASAPFAYSVTAKPLTITGVTAGNKEYDGTTAAVLTGGTLSSGVLGGETVTVVPGSGSFASLNAGTRAVTATGFTLGGANAGNYTLSAQPIVPDATITPRPVQLTGTRAYDGTTLAAAADLAIGNKVGGDDLILTGTAVLTGKDAGPQGLLAGFVTPARVGNAATGNTGVNAVASFTVNMASPAIGNTLIAVITTRGTSANRISSISQTGVTWTKAPAAEGVNTTSTSGSTTEIWLGSNIAAAAGTVATINVASSLRAAAVIVQYSGIQPSSPLDRATGTSGNSATASTGTTAATTQTNELWIGGIGLRDSTYNLGTPANAFAAVSNANSTNTTTNSNAKAFFLEKIVTATGTAVTTGAITSSHWSGAIATFKSAPVSTLALGGSAAVNYTLGSLTGSVAIISPANLTITANNRSKTYEQLLNFGSGATQFTSNGLRNGESIDSVTLTCAGGAASAAASTYPITPSAATGGTFSAGNYAITYSAGLLTVNALATTTTLSSSGSSTLYGEAVTLTATMSPNPDGGSVQFYDNSVALGTPVPLSGGQAQRVTSSLTTGSHSITAVYSGSTNFGGSAATAISQVVSKALATITTPPSASAITFGQTLASSTLSGGVGSVPGSFTFTAPATAPSAGTASHGVTFTPSDAANYQTATTSVDVAVDKALATITTAPIAAAITFGQTLASSTLSGGVASVPGSFTFTAPATAPNAGTASHSVTFTPSDAANYQNAATSVDVTVNPALTNFATWAADPAQGLTAGVNNLPDDDPDHDGFSNLLEFALGGAPMISSQAIRPQLESTGGIWSFSYDRNVLSKSSTTQIVEYGSNLTGWTPLPVPATSAGAVVITPGASTDHVKVSIPSLGANGFVRLKVSQ